MIYLHLYISESRCFWFEKYDINKQFQRVICNIILYFSSFNFILYPCIEKISSSIDSRDGHHVHIQLEAPCVHEVDDDDGDEDDSD